MFFYPPSQQPSRELTGGPWYTEHQDLDNDFIDGIRRHVLNTIGNDNSLTCDDVFEAYTVADAHTTTRWTGEAGMLERQDIQSILNTLHYDGILVAADGLYRRAAPMRHHNLMSVAGPCGICPVMDQCTPGGVVSPETCAYLPAWLDF